MGLSRVKIYWEEQRGSGVDFLLLSNRQVEPAMILSRGEGSRRCMYANAGVPRPPFDAGQPGGWVPYWHQHANAAAANQGRMPRCLCSIRPPCSIPHHHSHFDRSYLPPASTGIDMQMLLQPIRGRYKTAFAESTVPPAPQHISPLKL